MSNFEIVACFRTRVAGLLVRERKINIAWAGGSKSAIKTLQICLKEKIWTAPEALGGELRRTQRVPGRQRVESEEAP